MQGENKFNAYLSEKIRKMGTGYYAMKTSDRFSLGVSDFIIFYQGRAVTIESKFIKALPKREGLVLSHAFSPTQVSFMDHIGLAGVSCYGLIGIDDLRTMVLVERKLIPATGNWKKPEFVDTMEKSATFKFNEVQALVEHIFG